MQTDDERACKVSSLFSEATRRRLEHLNGSERLGKFNADGINMRYVCLIEYVQVSELPGSFIDCNVPPDIFSAFEAFQKSTLSFFLGGKYIYIDCISAGQT